MIKDTNDILTIVGGDFDFLAEVLVVFRGDIEDQMRILSESIESRDTITAGKAAHGLRGSVANFSCHVGADMAFEIEAALDRGQWPTVRSRFAELSETLDSLLEELDALVAAGA
ncbi:MAG: Hpt domain-containing protein [Acidobacteriota bacterium]